MRRRAEHLHDGLRRNLDWRFVPLVLIVFSVFSVFFSVFFFAFCMLFFVPLVLIVPVPLGTPAHHLGAQRAENPRQVPHPRLPGIAADDGLDRLVGDAGAVSRRALAGCTTVHPASPLVVSSSR